MNTKNSSWDYPLNNDDDWYEMILKCFNSFTDKNNPKQYIMHQYKLRDDAYELNYFLEKFKEYTNDLKIAYPPLCLNGFINNKSYPAAERAIYNWYLLMSVTPNSDKKTVTYKFGMEKTGVVSLSDFDLLNSVIDELLNIQPQKRKLHFTLNQIALMYVYNKNAINDSNCKSIAYKYNFTSTNSGHKLKQNYNDFIKTTDRTGDPGSKRKLNARINLIEFIIPHLKKNKQAPAKLELQTNQNLLKSSYS